MRSDRLFRRSILPATLLALVVTLPTVGRAAEPITCEPCGEECTGPEVVTVTNWETNDVRRYDCLKCGLALMASEWSWSRAVMEDAGSGDRIALTHARDRWEVSPSSAVVVTGPVATECKQARVFASREAFVKYAKKHPEDVEAAPRPIPALDFAKMLVATAHAAAAAGGPAGGGQPYPDVPRDHWARDSVEQATEAGLLTGDPDGKFRGGDGVTRYEMAVIIHRLLTRLETGDEAAPVLASEAGAEAGGPADTGDEASGNHSEQARELVRRLAEELEAAGVTRDDVDAALRLVAEAVPDETGVYRAEAPPSYRDVPSDHWAREAVTLVTSEGFMEGYPDQTFRGQQALTRYEMAVVLKRLLGAISGLEGPPTTVAQQEPPAEGGPPTPPEAGPGAGEGGRAAELLAELRREMKARGMSDEEIDRALGPASSALAERNAAAADSRIADLIAELEKELRSAGLAEDRVDEALRPLKGAVSPPPEAARDEAPEARAPTAAEGVNLFGQSGVLVTPSARILPRYVGSLGYARLNDANIGHLAFAPSDRFEVSIAHTSGDLPSRLLLGGKLTLYESSDKTTRVGVGVLDATDEIDTSLYGVASKDVELRVLGKPRRATISGGIGGGLLNGLFGGFQMGLTDRVSVLGEVVDFGGATRVNYGAEYRPNADLHIKAFSAQSEFGGAISYERDF